MTKTYGGLVQWILEIINTLILAIFAIVFLYFIWKMIDSWILNVGDEKKLKEGKSYAMSAILVLVLMVSAWGIVAILKSSIFG
jgi:hypothetical protein